MVLITTNVCNFSTVFHLWPARSSEATLANISIVTSYPPQDCEVAPLPCRKQLAIRPEVFRKTNYKYTAYKHDWIKGIWECAESEQSGITESL